MTPDAPDAPEYFVTKALSPLSPLPVHPPEPSSIPVLRNQIDPVLNMTSTFDQAPAALSGPAHPSDEPNSVADSPSDDSTFSDAYKQADGKEEIKQAAVNQGTVVSDDYAMTFDSDEEAHSDSQDVSQANIEQETTSLPVFVHTSHPPSLSHDAIVTDMPRDEQDHTLQDANSLPIQPTSNANPSESNPSQDQQDTKAQNHTYEDVANGGIDIQQLLDNITANAEKNEAASALSTPSSATATSLPKNLGLPSHSSLPPRPQVPAKRFHDDISKYHAGVPQTPFRSPGMNIVASGAPGTSTDPRSGLPPPPTASFRSPHPAGNPTSPGSYHKGDRQNNQDRMSLEPHEHDDANVRWGPEMQKKYDDFITQERIYVAEGMWDKFPLNSRLFIGNLPSEKVTKRDVFHIFHKYGTVAQIAIKQAYGFVQFETADSCFTALDHEQGAVIRDKKMHLEISKPQKNTRNAQTSAAPQRARSPDYSRGNMSDRGRQGSGRGNDRYDGRSGSVRKDEYGRPLRDDYRPGRAHRPASPPRDLRQFYGQDDQGYNRRGRDSYDGHNQRRSRSRSPDFAQRDNGRYRERSPSPRTQQANEDASLQIPRRTSYDIPDVQIILLAQLDRNFVSWVESELVSRGLKSEVMFLSPRLNLEAVIRRQIMEGVHAVSLLDTQAQNSSKIPLRVFDRQAGANNVRFDEYRDLDPKIAAELVLRAKQTQVPSYIPPGPAYSTTGVPQYPPAPTPAYAPPPTPSYAPPQPQYAPPQQYQPPAVTIGPDISNLVGQLDNATLQKLLSSINSQQPTRNAPATVANSSINLAGILGGLHQAQPQHQPAYQQSPPADPYAGYSNGVATQQQAPQQNAQSVQNIMAQLRKFQQ
ncbi:putative RNA-binding [Hyphodiscus hymeniophilus]|uniref:RNA-binding n=1 Tax=Hyphodiscus hymeniophilus TaxID=353542 RepID=A0A9P6VFZ1_9HELO|nr:putative RNA-binding [Hyphodiscus hymeniophilus]